MTQFTGKIIFHIEKAKHLKNADLGGKSDPFYTIYFDEEKKYTSRVIRNDLNPVWDDEVMIGVVGSVDVIKICVTDEDKLGDDFLAEYVFSASVLLEGGVESPVRLSNEKGKVTKQELYFSVYYAPNDEGAVGKKKALMTGILYKGRSDELSGCANDVLNMKEYILTRGYTEENITILSDGIEGAIFPSKNNFIRELEAFLSDIEDGDEIFLYYSGHGGQEADQNGDEDDGFDEVICLLTEDGKHIDTLTDDILSDYVHSIPIGAKLVSIMDCCHSGSILDLPYQRKVEGTILQSAYRFLKGIAGQREKRNRLKLRNERDIVLFSGCKDRQESTDAQISETESQGALTYVMLQILNQSRENGYELTFRDTLQNLLGIHDNLAQIPQLTTGYNLDLSQPFNF
eukprot:TRINITY_DN8340_c0_g1_i1.p1 TRINITY_DN8340_c0_g1~~TRINITY_DN8340_c0_g1_i1.p1  ORF type:complete len:401 (-),score=91.32 TRINITY_DN8340_c0_g1_i1:12-1214(-)